jgi:tetratricopeptide (TPR) repeat protein
MHSYRRLLTCVLLFAAMAPPAAAQGVKAWEENVVIPTYVPGPPDQNPMFYFGRAYQGAEGRVYPYPLYDKLTATKVDKTWQMVYLENEYVKIGILPEIGGRIFSAQDKTNGYDFFYRQHVIKPALIGMLGAWISGGVEWNIPHHHRPSSYLPVQHSIEEHADGSKTVWVGELELRHRMRWAIGLTLRPGRSYLEANIRILNRTPLVNTILAWANVAVHTNDNYQVIFPPSTQFGTHHAKREFVRWPIADSMYGGSDFRGGVDVSRMKNHQFGNSIFAWNYIDDFLAGYDYGKNAGTLSVADHHVVPGKKLWTWGNGPGGRLWDKILTDTDGPYIELMVGAYSDNQPDYSWIQPFEAKDYKQFWYPFRDIGGVKNATLEAAVNLEPGKVGFYATAAHKQAIVLVKAGGKVVLRETIAISPDKPYVKQFALPAGVKFEDVRASLSAGGKELVAYQPIVLKPEKMPDPVTPPPAPADIKTNEELYLAGLRIDQFHNPGLEPDPYWEEALRRDPGDARVNTALGIAYLKRMRFSDAEARFRAAIARLTHQYTSPKDGEPFYYLGVALKAQGREAEAYDAFYKSIWSAAWQSPGYFGLGEIATARGDYPAALDFTERSIKANALNTRAWNLKSAVLRHMDRRTEALAAAKSAADVDPLDVTAMAERNAAALPATLKAFPAAGLESAIDYANAGLWSDASAVLEKAPGDPLAYYYLGVFSERLGRKPQASEYFRKAAVAPAGVFPFQYEAAAILRRAMEANPKDARAPYNLGNLLFDSQPAEAVKLWESSRALDPSFPIVHRNLAAAYSREEKGLDKAIASLEKAVSLGGRDALHLFELDQLYEAAGASPAKRLAMLEQHHETVNYRDDALAREIALKVNLGKYDDAIRLMTGRRFNVWEGGARFNVHDVWTDAHLLRGHQRFAARQYKDALADYRTALEFPETLQVARFRTGGRFPEVSYWIGLAQDALGQKDAARATWKECSAELPHVGADDILPTTDRTVLLYYQASALGKLGESARAKELFSRLVKSGERALSQGDKVDFFAKFGEQQTQRGRLAQAHYVSGLGYAGLEDTAAAKREFTRALELSPDHLGAKTALAQLQ